MNIQIGIPRALLFHEFGVLWQNFFEHAKIPYIISPETNKEILSKGTDLAIDESCIPLKLFLGHIAALIPQCTHLFVPRVTGIYPGYYLCGKLAGLPDIVKNTFSVSPDQVIAPNLEHKTSLSQFNALRHVCQGLGLSTTKGLSAYRTALNSLKTVESPELTQPTVAVIGHSYILKDTFFAKDIMDTIHKNGLEAVTPETVPAKTLYQEAQEYQADIYWQLSAKTVGAAKYFCRMPNIKGVVLVSSFGCGPDTLINEYIEHHILGDTIPHMIITVDEHTGTAGLMTRVEAFLDLVKWRSRT